MEASPRGRELRADRKNHWSVEGEGTLHFLWAGSGSGSGTFTGSARATAAESGAHGELRVKLEPQPCSKPTGGYATSQATPAGMNGIMTQAHWGREGPTADLPYP